MSLIKFTFFKTIKFKLAIIFTSILFVLTGSIILLFNLAIDNYLSTRVPQSDQVNLAEPLPIKQIVVQPKDLRALYSDNLESIQKKSVESLIPLAILCFALGYYLAGRFLRPLEQLNRQIEILKTDTLGSQIDIHSDDEIGKTITIFNGMSLRLKESFKKQTQFVEDASHELRTPLTIMRTNLETVLDDTNASAVDLRKSMEESLLELDSVTKLANDLLVLSKPQSNQRQIENIFDIVQGSVYEMKSLAVTNKVSLIFETQKSNFNVLINKLEISRAIKNIIDNAIKYSKNVDSPIVTVKIVDKIDSVSIDISDNGKGIPLRDLDKIFDRFYRVDKSRDRDTGGFGLGLSIVKKIITEHNGDILVKSEPFSTVFKISLPKIKNV